MGCVNSIRDSGESPMLTRLLSTVCLIVFPSYISNADHGQSDARAPSRISLDVANQLRNPELRRIGISNLPVVDALSILSHCFDRQLNQYGDLSALHRHRVTIRRQCASLPECIADLCSQTGLYPSEGLDGVILPSTTSGRNLIFGHKGVILSLQFAKSDTTRRTTLICLLSAERPLGDYLSGDVSIKCIRLGNGTVLGGLHDQAGPYKLDSSQLLLNSGKIASISGEIVIRMPRQVYIHRQNIAHNTRTPSTPGILLSDVASNEKTALKQGKSTFLRQLENEQRNGIWRLTLAYGVSKRSKLRQERLPRCVVFDANGNRLTGVIQDGTGSGMFISGPQQVLGSIESLYNLEVNEYQSQPHAVEWRYASGEVLERISFTLRNCEVPRASFTTMD